MSTYRHKLLLKSMVSHQQPLETGQRVEKSNLSDPMEDGDSIVKKMSIISSDKPKLKLKIKLETEYSMPESVQLIKQKTSQDKSNSCNQDIQQINSSKDIGSGLNWKRPGLETLLERIYQEGISEIVVAYKDRLCRFGFELFEWICQKHNTKILVLNHVSETEDRTKELAEDLFSIVTVFVAKNNGLRASKNRQNRIKSQKNQDDPQSSTDDET